jgi:hypothetical protein
MSDSVLATPATAELLVAPLADVVVETNPTDGGAVLTEFHIPLGSIIESIEYVGVSYTAEAPGNRSDLRLTVADGISGDAYILGAPDSPGSFGPVSANFLDAFDFSFAPPFPVEHGPLVVGAFSVGAAGTHMIHTGEVHVTYTVPEPSALGLWSFVIAAAVRRRV